MTRRRKKKNLTKTEPALYRGAVVGVLSLLAALGFSWAADVDKETIGLIAGAAALVVPLVQAWWTRRAVTPAQPEDYWVPERDSRDHREGGGHPGFAP